MNLILLYPHEIHGEKAILPDCERSAHIRGVLRAGPGKALRVGLINGPRGTATVESVDGREVVLRCRFEERLPPRPSMDLLLAMPRPKVMKRLWAQLAAIGVGRIFILNAAKVERCYFDTHILDPGFYAGRLTEGLQQAVDTRMPEVRIVRELRPFIEDESGALFPPPALRLLADPSGSSPLIRCIEGAVSPRVCLAVGPEGGWTPYELELFAAHGFKVFNAGSRILRTDTACVALLSAIALLSPR